MYKNQIKISKISWLTEKQRKRLTSNYFDVSLWTNENTTDIEFRKAGVYFDVGEFVGINKKTGSDDMIAYVHIDIQTGKFEVNFIEDLFNKINDPIF